MSELKDLLAMEAKRHEPERQPPFEELLQRRRRRDRRTFAVMGSVVVAALAVTLGPVLLRQQRVESPDTPGAQGGVAVTGVLLTVGGRPGAGSDGLAGTLWFEAADGTTTSTTAGDDGRFSILIPPGTYIASGRPGFLDLRSPSGDGASVTSGVDGVGPSSVATTAWCRAEAPVVVPAGGLHGVQVICQLR
ncbi:hypothetical protein [Dactylosporangium sp. NPDC050588]|uniref:hypothetical protein n=1 Tax=Dactylosporangium sp. NPDC050588 TaxID=3157211 RepID=UPI0033FAEE34